MINELIAPRRPYWRDWQYDWRLRERYVRQWHRQIGYGEAGWGAARYMSSSMREEFIKAFEQFVHTTSGLGERMQVDIIRRYYDANPERRAGVDYRRELPYVSRYSDARAVPRRELLK